MDVTQRVFNFIILLVGTLLGLLIAGYAVLSYPNLVGVTGPFTGLQSFVNTGSSVILALVTAAYVILTWSLVTETRDARKQEVMPIFALELEGYSIGAMGPKLKNIGNGPATSVSATFQLKPGGEEHQVSSKNVAPGDFVGSLDPKVPVNSDSGFEELRVSGTFTNVFGEEKPLDDSIDLEIFLQNTSADSLMGRDQSVEILKKINRNLKSISESIEMNEFEDVLKMEKRRRIVEELEEAGGSLTLKELSQRLGLMTPVVAAWLTWMEDADVVEYDVEPDEIMDQNNSDTEIRLANSS
ncbi:hypothetical protein [Halosimplex halobium]|uniref:hypothetical protein n=1 Tax=Halosimplex halobium TaxID=3396618 RepID=UPI003F55C24D